MKLGLIGRKLSHSFSKKYFTEKWQEEGITGHSYDHFELHSISDLHEVLENQRPNGLNVTVPYKEEVLPFLDKLDPSARKVGAVNVLKIEEDGITGYNSDYYGFRQSLESWMDHDPENAYILGSGGASKAVQAVLEDLQIVFNIVSRTPDSDQVSYDEIQLLPFPSTQLIVNTTPLGMFPSENSCPDLEYDQLHAHHFLYDLVYNPAESLFLQRGRTQGARVKNGLEMLQLQAEKSWEIWNS